MDTNSIYTVLITIVTVLGSTSAWRYWEKRALRKEKSEDYMKDESRERILKLEILLEKSAIEKDEMRHKILELTKEVTELRVKVEYLEDKNRELLIKANIREQMEKSLKPEVKKQAKKKIKPTTPKKSTK